MDIHVAKVLEDGNIYWVIYQSGKFSTPILLLPDFQMRSLISKVQEIYEKEEYDGQGNRKEN